MAPSEEEEKKPILPTATELTERTRILAENVVSTTEQAARATGSSENADDTKLSPVEQAAWLVEDAMLGMFDKDALETKTVEQRETYIRYENMAYPERTICATLLVFVSFVEVPGWCLPERKNVFYWAGSAICDKAAPGFVYLSDIDYFPVLLTVFIEYCAVGYLAFLAFLENGFDKSLKLKLRVGFSAIYVLDLLWFTFALFAGYSPWFRLGPYCRIGLFVVSFDSVYNSCCASLALIPAFVDVFSLLVLVVAFFGWLTAITFDDFRFENHEGQMVNEGFETFHDALYTTFMAATTADFPDPTIPSTVYRRFFGIFWAFFATVAVFLFLNLLLAVVYNEYSDYVKAHTQKYYSNRAKGLAAAFKLLADNKSISKEKFGALVEETNKVERVPTVSPGTLDWFFSVMDDDGSGNISAEEFYDVCDILQYSFKRICTKTFAELHRPEWTQHEYYKLIHEHVHETKLVEKAVSIALFVNVGLVLIQSYTDLQNTETDSEELFWGYVEFLFSLFYTAALCAILLVTPFDEFWMKIENRFDFFVTSVLFVAALYWISPFTKISPAILHYLVILRLLRLVDLIVTLKRFRFIGSCISKIIPASFGVLGILFAFAAIWATFGVQFFGGLVYDGNPDLEDTDYVDAHYQILNFNDFGLAFLPLFAMSTTGAPYDELIEGLDNVSSFPAAGVVFYFTWYVVGCLVLANVFSAYVIDAFLSQFTFDREKQNIVATDGEPDEELHSLDQTLAGENYRIAAKRGSVTDDVYKAMFMEES